MELMQAERALGQAAQHAFSMDLSAHRVKGTAVGPTKDLTFVPEEIVQRALQLADDALALFGRRHWIWQSGLLFAIDLDISLLRFASAQCSDYSKYVVTVVSSLLDMWDWLSTVSLTQDPACWLYTRAEKLLAWVPRTLDPTLSRCCDELQRRISDIDVAADTLGSRAFLPKGMASTLAN